MHTSSPPPPRKRVNERALALRRVALAAPRRSDISYAPKLALHPHSRQITQAGDTRCSHFNIYTPFVVIAEGTKWHDAPKKEIGRATFPAASTRRARVIVS